MRTTIKHGLNKSLAIKQGSSASASVPVLAAVILCGSATLTAGVHAQSTGLSSFNGLSGFSGFSGFNGAGGRSGDAGGIGIGVNNYDLPALAGPANAAAHRHTGLPCADRQYRTAQAGPGHSHSDHRSCHQNHTNTRVVGYVHSHSHGNDANTAVKYEYPEGVYEAYLANYKRYLENLAVYNASLSRTTTVAAPAATRLAIPAPAPVATRTQVVTRQVPVTRYRYVQPPPVTTYRYIQGPVTGTGTTFTTGAPVTGTVPVGPAFTTGAPVTGGVPVTGTVPVSPAFTTGIPVAGGVPLAGTVPVAGGGTFIGGSPVAGGVPVAGGGTFIGGIPVAGGGTFTGPAAGAGNTATGAALPFNQIFGQTR